MKKLITVLLATMLMFSMTAFAEEADVTGEWYGTMMGINIAMNFNEDGTYAMTTATSPDNAMEGTWELRDGEVVVDPDTDTEGSFAFDGETLTMEGDDYEVVLTREPVEEFVPAEPVEDAQLEDYEGEWVSGMVEAMGVTVDGKAAGLELKAKVEGTTVTLDSGTLGFADQSIDFEFKDGALTFETGMDEAETEAETEGISFSTSIKLQLLEDGTMAIYMEAMGQDVVLYMTPAEAGETEAETEGISFSTSIKLQLLEDGTMAIYMEAMGQDVVLYMTPAEETEVETETETETEAA